MYKTSPCLIPCIKHPVLAIIKMLPLLFHLSIPLLSIITRVCQSKFQNHIFLPLNASLKNDDFLNRTITPFTPLSCIYIFVVLMVFH